MSFSYSIVFFYHRQIITHSQKYVFNPKTEYTAVQKIINGICWQFYVANIYFRNREMFCSFIKKYLFSFLFFSYIIHTKLSRLCQAHACIQGWIWITVIFLFQYISLFISCVLRSILCKNQKIKQGSCHSVSQISMILTMVTSCG